MRTAIIYEDEHILVVRKPAGLATQTAKVGQQDMVSELKNYLASGQKGKAPYLGVIHRLDQPVEGLLVFAKTKQAAAVLTKQLGNGTLNKQYYAVICGKPVGESGELVDYLYKDAGGKAQIVTGKEVEERDTECFDAECSGVKCSDTECSDVKDFDAKAAVLQYKIVKELFTGQPLFLADIRIDTGRFHQIRAQMAHAGMPLLGDSKYGSEKSMALSRQYGIRNVALCAYRLELIHPVTGKQLSFTVEPEGKAFSIQGR